MVKKEPNSTSKSDLPQTPPNVQYSQSYSQLFADETTIDFYALFITLWNKRWLVIAMTLVAALGSVYYAQSLPSIYKAEARLLPPNNMDVQSLNVQGVTGIAATEVFGAFRDNLNSRTLQKKFIIEYGLMELLAPKRDTEIREEEIYQRFAGMFQISNTGVLRVSIELHDAEVAAQLVNDFVEFMDGETIRLLSDDMRNSISNQIQDIEYKIGSKRQMAKHRRQDTIIRYEEAIHIARYLGVKDRVVTTNVVQNNQLNISTSATPLYFRGYKALSAEIEILRARKDDDAYISGIRDLQENLALLRSININSEGLHSVTIDQAAYPSKTRSNPKRRMIVTIGTAAGLFLGIFLAFFVSFVMKLKEDYSEKS